MIQELHQFVQDLDVQVSPASPADRYRGRRRRAAAPGWWNGVPVSARSPATGRQRGQVEPIGAVGTRELQLGQLRLEHLRVGRGRAATQPRRRVMPARHRRPAAVQPDRARRANSVASRRVCSSAGQEEDVELLAVTAPPRLARPESASTAPGRSRRSATPSSRRMRPACRRAIAGNSESHGQAVYRARSAGSQVIRYPAPATAACRADGATESVLDPNIRDQPAEVVAGEREVRDPVVVTISSGQLAQPRELESDRNRTGMRHAIRDDQGQGGEFRATATPGRPSLDNLSGRAPPLRTRSLRC